MQNSVTPAALARLRRRVPARCPERLGFNAVRYLWCQRQPGHPGKCWAEGWSWNVVGRDQARRYEPSEPAPGDVSAPWTPRRQRGAQRPRTRQVRDKGPGRGRRNLHARARHRPGHGETDKEASA